MGLLGREILYLLGFSSLCLFLWIGCRDALSGVWKFLVRPSSPNATSALSVDSPLKGPHSAEHSFPLLPLTARFVVAAGRFPGLNQEHNRSFGGEYLGKDFLKKSFPGNSSKILFALALLALFLHDPFSLSLSGSEDPGGCSEDGCGLATSEQGHIPYQRWLIPPWDEDLRTYGWWAITISANTTGSR